MSIVATNVNYATPSYESIVDESYSDYTKYFSLHNNVLDGSFHPLGNTTPLWGASLSDANGFLAAPLAFRIQQAEVVHSLMICGDYAANVYPVEFTIARYDSNWVELFMLVIHNNTNIEWVSHLDMTYEQPASDYYVVTITKINKPNYVARITNASKPHILVRSVDTQIDTTAVSYFSSMLIKFFSDSLLLKHNTTKVITANVAAADSATIAHSNGIAALITNKATVDDTLTTIQTTTNAVQNSFNKADTAIININGLTGVENRFNRVDTNIVNMATARSTMSNIFNKKLTNLLVTTEDAEDIRNIHTVMNAPSRRTYGKVAITYMNPLVDDKLVISSSGSAYNTTADQVSNAFVDTANKKLFLGYNLLNGLSHPIEDGEEEIGWWSDAISDANGNFVVSPSLAISFTARLMTSLTIISSAVNDIVLVDYTIEVTTNGTIATYEIIGNTDYSLEALTDPLAEVTKIEIFVHKINRPYANANIMEIPIASTVWYEQDNLLSIDMLEELTYDDNIEALGGVSANELNVSINNTNKQFYFNSTESLVSKQLKKNRKIVAYLGAEVVPGEIEWHCLGTYWSHSWGVPVRGLYATVTAFDTIGLLGTTLFYNHQVYINKSIGFLIDTVLADAKLSYNQLEWYVDPSLYNLVIPYAWFENGKHMAALTKIAQCCRINIYCDRDGKVVAKPRISNVVDTYATWSDSTNVKAKTYPTLYTTVPNVIAVSITEVTLAVSEVITSTVPFNVNLYPKRSFTASDVIVDNIVVTLDADATVVYTYVAYSWGIDFVFGGTGTVRSISVSANSISTKQDTAMESVNEESVLLNGTTAMNIKSDFIQTSLHAHNLANEILADASLDLYDSDVDYSGDIALSISDPITLLDGIAPTNKYFIKRHELQWSGSLSGKAKLNT